MRLEKECCGKLQSVVVAEYSCTVCLPQCPLAPGNRDRDHSAISSLLSHINLGSVECSVEILIYIKLAHSWYNI